MAAVSVPLIVAGMVNSPMVFSRQMYRPGMAKLAGSGGGTVVEMGISHLARHEYADSLTGAFMSKHTGWCYLILIRNGQSTTVRGTRIIVSGHQHRDEVMINIK